MKVLKTSLAQCIISYGSAAADVAAAAWLAAIRLQPVHCRSPRLARRRRAASSLLAGPRRLPTAAWALVPSMCWLVSPPCCRRGTAGSSGREQARAAGRTNTQPAAETGGSRHSRCGGAAWPRRHCPPRPRPLRHLSRQGEGTAVVDGCHVQAAAAGFLFIAAAVGATPRSTPSFAPHLLHWLREAERAPASLAGAASMAVSGGEVAGAGGRQGAGCVRVSGLAQLPPQPTRPNSGRRCSHPNWLDLLPSPGLPMRSCCSTWASSLRRAFISCSSRSVRSSTCSSRPSQRVPRRPVLCCTSATSFCVRCACRSSFSWPECVRGAGEVEGE